MAIINRTPDSFYDRRVRPPRCRARPCGSGRGRGGPDRRRGRGQRPDQGRSSTPTRAAGGLVRRGGGVEVPRRRHLRGHVASRRRRGRACATLLNDAWGGHDPRLAEVAAARRRPGVHTCRWPHHTPGRTVSSTPDVMAWCSTTCWDRRSAQPDLGVQRSSILIGPGHDFGKRTPGIRWSAPADCPDGSRPGGPCWSR